MFVKEKKPCYLLFIILVNIVVLGVLLLLFEATGKSDDYDMANALFGGIAGETSPFILYINPLLGYVLQFLVNIFPSVSWLYITEIFSIFLSFCIISWILLKKNNIQKFYLFYSVLMLFAGYEFYIRITFTKTAGILILTGFLYILYAIDEECQKTRIIGGMMLILLGTLWRTGMLDLIIEIFFSAFIAFLITSIKKGDKKIVVRTFTFIIVVIILLISGELIGRSRNFFYERDQEWKEYLSYNSARSALFDYGMPDYDTYKEEYNNLGVSKNDYLLWSKTANIADPDVLSVDMMKKIRSIKQDEENSSSIRTFWQASQNLLDYLLGNTMFYLLICCIVLLILCGEKRKRIIIAPLCICLLFAYYYMYFRGRTQHHVDACIILAAAVILLYYGSNTKKTCKDTLMKIGLHIGLIFIIFINKFYEDITTSSYLGPSYADYKSERVQVQKNYDRLSLLSDDATNFYLISSYETHTIYQCFTTFQAIEKGFYHNLFRQNQYTVPLFRKPLENYGIKNPYKEIVNSTSIYYCVSDRCKNEMDIILQYIREHYYPNAYYTLVKSVEGLYIYRFSDGDLQIKISRLQNKNEVIKEVHSTLNGDTLEISGYAFIEGIDSYAQDIYIETENIESGERDYYFTLQEKNPKYATEDKMNGKYSLFSVSLSVSDLENKQTYLIVKNENGTYRLPIEISI